MNTRKIALAVAAGATLLAAAPAFAHGDRWDHRGNGWRGHHSHYRDYRGPAYVYAPRPVVVAPRPYYYAPPRPVYYAPAPRYYAPPAPVVYGTVPLGDARISFGVGF